MTGQERPARVAGARTGPAAWDNADRMPPGVTQGCSQAPKHLKPLPLIRDFSQDPHRRREHPVPADERLFRYRSRLGRLRYVGGSRYAQQSIAEQYTGLAIR